MLQIQEGRRDENQVKRTHFGVATAARIVTPGKTAGSYMASLQISLEKIMAVGEEIQVTSLNVMLLI